MFNYFLILFTCTYKLYFIDLGLFSFLYCFVGVFFGGVGGGVCEVGGGVGTLNKTKRNLLRQTLPHDVININILLLLLLY